MLKHHITLKLQNSIESNCSESNKNDLNYVNDENDSYVDDGNVSDIIKSYDEIKKEHSFAEGILCLANLEQENTELYKKICKKVDLYAFNDDKYKILLTERQRNLIKTIIIHDDSVNIDLDSQNS